MKPHAMLAFALLSVALFGCASRPENIRAAYVSEMSFNGWTKDQMLAEQGRLISALSSASIQQHNTRANDTAGIWLLGVPISSMTGRGVEAEIANLKGALEALRKAGISAGYQLPEVDIDALTKRKA